MAWLHISAQDLLLVRVLCGAWLYCISEADQGCCRRLKFTAPPADGKRLEGHVFLNLSIGMYTPCEHRCIMESKCVSVNVGPVGNDEVVCELSDSDHLQHPQDLKQRIGWTYRGTENPCTSSPCFHKGTCLNGFSDKGYHCLCPSGYTGENCEQDINECAMGTHSCSAKTICNNTEGSYSCERVSSCREIYDRKISLQNKAYPLMVDDEVINVYCHMTMENTGNGACGDGGWTLVMKIDGSKTTFLYTSSLWTNNNIFNLAGGETGFDTEETKLPTYWNTSFSKICLGMMINQQITFIVINQQASSLYSLIADGIHRPTSLGRDTWKSLIGSQASLQQNCNREGFNAKSGIDHHAKARIGILSNNENDCRWTDSRIGFGSGGTPNYHNACGNEAKHGGDNGDKSIMAMGFIFVQ